jgi:hypothetical protein
MTQESHEKIAAHGKNILYLIQYDGEKLLSNKING